MEVGFRIGVDLKTVTSHLVMETSRWEVHFFLRLFVVFMDNPGVFLSRAIGAASVGIRQDMLVTSDDRHGEKQQVVILAYETGVNGEWLMVSTAFAEHNIALFKIANGKILE